MLRSTLLFRSVTLLAVLGAAACSDGGGTGPLPPGSIRGEVRADDGVPVAGAIVELTRVPADSMRRAETGADGRFAFAPLPSGTYDVAVVPPLGFEAPAAPLRVTVNGGAEAPASVVVRAVRVATAPIPAGASDTIALASGLVLEVTGGVSPVNLRAAEAPDAGFDALSLVSTPVEVTVSAPGSPSLHGARRTASAAEGDTKISVQVHQRIPTCTAGTTELAFQVSRRAEDPPLFLYAEASCTTYRDPVTGRTGQAVSGSVELAPGARVTLGAFRTESTCAGGGRVLYTAGGEPVDPSRTPVILIHGWQPEWRTCEPFNAWRPEADTWKPMISALNAAEGVSDRYQLFVLRYPTFEPIANTVAFLRQQVETRGWTSREIVMVGHSMGGLVGRGYLAAYGDAGVRALFTLGTPHTGSPLANDDPTVEAVVDACTGDFGVRRLRAWGGTDGFRDLGSTSAWITALAGNRAGAARTFTLAGTAGRLDPAYLWLGDCVLGALAPGVPNDGIVTVPSATPNWTAFQMVLGGHDHQEVKEDDAIPHVRDALRRLAVCRAGTPPAPPSSNAFPLSGTVARLSGGAVDVVLNPIVVDGVHRRGLTADNFMVIENDCIMDLRITTAEGNLGVDLVFIQDLSGSMAGEITGVRNSVLSFAASLASRGLNVRMGSVGFSGGGSLITHPNAGSCESLGPVQDFGSPETFRAHVSAQWQANGGCDSPENALEAIQHAHEALSWRPGAARVYVLITDISIHTATTNCNGGGPCTDQTLESILALLGSTATVHAVAPSSAATRTQAGGLDAWLLAERTGGVKAVLTSTLDLNTLGITDRIAEVVRLTFTSISTPAAHHRIRVRVQVDGRVAELAPGLVRYDIHPSLARGRTP